jgi:hypothetical protein
LHDLEGENPRLNVWRCKGQIRPVTLRLQMTDLNLALRNVRLVYHDLHKDYELQIDPLRIAYGLLHPNGGKGFKMKRWVIEAAAERFPDLLHKTVMKINRPQKAGVRRSCPTEQLRGLTHGFEYGGQVSGGNFGASF